MSGSRPLVFRERSARFIVAAALLLGLAVYVLIPSPIVTPDSPGYILFDASRTVPYPLFLRSVGVQAAPAAQVALFAASAAILALVVLQVSGSRYLALAVLVGVYMNPETDKLQLSILTEGLSLPLSLLLIALIVRFSFEPRWTSVGMIAVVTGLLAATRPMFYALVLIAPAASLLRKRYRWAQSSDSQP